MSNISRSAALCLLLSCALAGARTIDVPAEHASIQEAIVAAAAGDTVRVAPGTYEEKIDLLGKGIVVTGTDPDDWAVVAATVVDASGEAGSVVTISSGEDATSALRGLLLRGGIGTEWELPATGRAGGGVYCEATSARLERCIVRGNSAEGGREHGRGAGLYCTGGAAPTIHDCVIDSNQSTGDAGGIFCTASSPTISACNVSDNICVDSGCGIYCRQGAAPLIESCLIAGNRAYDSGAGLYCKEESNPTIRGCTISGNEALESGGGIKCKMDAAPWIVDCSITDNIVTGQGSDTGGGGLYCIDGAPLVSGCTISGNQAADYGGGAACIQHSAPTFDRCTITGNSVSNLHGGGLFAHRSSVMLRRCVIEGNHAGGSGGGLAARNGAIVAANNLLITGNSAALGGGLHADDARIDALNCTIADNSASSSGGGAELVSRWRREPQELRSTVVWGNQPEQVNVELGAPALDYCNVEGGWPGRGNIDLDPLFRDPAGGDYRLEVIACGGVADSPSIDAGDPSHDDTVRDRAAGLGSARADQGAHGGPGVRLDCALDAYLDQVPATVLGGDTLAFGTRLANRCQDALAFDRVVLEGTGPVTVQRVLFSGSDQVLSGGAELGAPFALAIPQNAPLGSYTLTLSAELDGTLLCAAVARMTIARPIRVPADQPSIGAALAVAQTGDVVVVAPGSYSESGLDFGGKAITLRGQAPEDSATVAETVIDGGGAGSVLRFVSAETRMTHVEGLTIRGGAAAMGAGVLCSGASPTLARCVITGNGATGSGGGIYAAGGAPRIERCTLTANGAARGAAIAGQGASLEIVATRIGTNAAGAEGGALALEGGGASALLGCLIDANSAGGAVHVDDAALEIRNCTVVGNTATAGGAIAARGTADPRVHNSILWGDSPDEIDGTASDVRYSDVAGGWPGVGNRDIDPLLITLMGRPYALDPASTCIDTGDPEIFDSATWPFWYKNDPISDLGAYGGPGGADWFGMIP